MEIRQRLVDRFGKSAIVAPVALRPGWDQHCFSSVAVTGSASAPRKIDCFRKNGMFVEPWKTGRLQAFTRDQGTCSTEAGRVMLKCRRNEWRQRGNEPATVDLPHLNVREE